MGIREVMNIQPHSKFIVFEGIDGSGKTTQVKMLMDKSENFTYPTYFTSEPTRTGVGAYLRNILAGKEVLDSKSALIYLFLADRAEHQLSMIDQIVNQYHHVVLDRYILSTMAYQCAPSIGWDFETLAKSNRHFYAPDITFYLDMSVDKALERIAKRSRISQDIYENPRDLAQIKTNYRLAKPYYSDYFKDIFISIDANRNEHDVHEEIVLHLKKLGVINN